LSQEQDYEIDELRSKPRPRRASETNLYLEHPRDKKKSIKSLSKEKNARTRREGAVKAKGFKEGQHESEERD